MWHVVMNVVVVDDMNGKAGLYGVLHTISVIVVVKLMNCIMTENICLKIDVKSV